MSHPVIHVEVNDPSGGKSICVVPALTGSWLMSHSGLVFEVLNDTQAIALAVTDGKGAASKLTWTLYHRIGAHPRYAEAARATLCQPGSSYRGVPITAHTIGDVFKGEPLTVPALLLEVWRQAGFFLVPRTSIVEPSEPPVQSPPAITDPDPRAAV